MSIYSSPPVLSRAIKAPPRLKTSLLSSDALAALDDEMIMDEIFENCTKKSINCNKLKLKVYELLKNLKEAKKKSNVKDYNQKVDILNNDVQELLSRISYKYQNKDINQISDEDTNRYINIIDGMLNEYSQLLESTKVKKEQKINIKLIITLLIIGLILLTFLYIGVAWWFDDWFFGLAGSSPRNLF